MIDAKELRIGNWIKLVSDHEQYEMVDLLVLEECEQFPCYQPIPITPEILEKCGFEFAFQRWSHNRTTFLIEFAGSHCQLIQLQYIGKPFQYLHQLQNLYYALTQKELEIKL